MRSQWEGWIDSNNIEALANKIDYAISIPEAHRDLICKRARTTAEGHDIHLQANKVKRLYSDLASGKM